MENLNHIRFEWDNAYDVYSADALNKAMRIDIIATCEEDGYHFRSKGDLQPLIDVCTQYGLNLTIIEILPGVQLSILN